MAHTPDGEPAFPETHYYDDKPIGVTSGMSLRDYFAAKSMAATISTRPICETEDTGGEGIALIDPDDLEAVFDAIASSAYAMADAMLKERLK